MSDDELTELVPIDLSNEMILKLALEAHELDITLNQHIRNILKYAEEDVKEHKNKKDN